MNYYNEHDPFAAAWLRELILAGHIGFGVVDERSIEDVTPADLDGFTQCHFFAGIGVWSYALRRAGWPDDRPAWTGSCPCQPFSAAGKRGGAADERHLWPAWFHLIEQCRPGVVFGEQVEAYDWLDLVQSDLEGAGYVIGAVGLAAGGFGAPHIRQRLFFVADSDRNTSRRNAGAISGEKGEIFRCEESEIDRPKFMRAVESSKLGDAIGSGLERLGGGHQTEKGRNDAAGSVAPSNESDILEQSASEQMGVPRLARAGRTTSHWSDCDWLFCRDGKWRPVEPGTSPLAHGAAARVGRLRGYGNAIVAPVAQAFVGAYLETQR